MPADNSKKKFLFDAMKKKADDFRMPDDGRQWRASAAQRKSLFINLAAFADSVGRGACPSNKTLCERTGFSRSTTFRYLADLLLAGWIVNRGKSRFQGTATWDLNLIPIVPDSPSNGVKVETATVSKSLSNGVKVKPNSLKVEPTVSKSKAKQASLTPDLSLDLPTGTAQKDICPPTHLPETDGGMDGAVESNSSSKAGQVKEQSLWHRLFDAYEKFYETGEKMAEECKGTSGEYPTWIGGAPQPTTLPRVGIEKLEASLPELLSAGYDIDQVVAGWSHWLWAKYLHNHTRLKSAESPIKMPVALFAEEAQIYIHRAIKQAEVEREEQTELERLAAEKPTKGPTEILGEKK